MPGGRSEVLKTARKAHDVRYHDPGMQYRYSCWSLKKALAILLKTLDLNRLLVTMQPGTQRLV
jgi:hypothetical protein